MATVSKFANSNAVVTTGWTNPTNAYSDDGVYATALPAKNASVTSDYGFANFTTTDIPTGSIINSVTLEIQYKASVTTSTGSVMGLQGVDNGTLADTEATGGMVTTDTLLTRTVSGVTLADLAAGLVKARVRGGRTSSNTAITWSVDYVKITVDWSTPPPQQDITAAGGIGTAEAFGTPVLTQGPPLDTYGATVIADGAVSFWRFDEASGTTAVDKMGVQNATHNANVSVGQTGIVPALSGLGVVYDGTAAATTAADNNAHDFNANLSVEAWVKPSISFAAGVFRTIAAKVDASGSVFQLQYNGLKLEFRLDVGGTTYRVQTTADSPLVSGNVYHVVGVRNGTSGELYINGVLAGSLTIGSGGIVTTTAPVLIGAQGTERFAGTIDELALYGVALTSTQIAAHYAAGQSAGPSTQDVTATGAIASAEAFGTEVVGRGTMNVTAAGAIASLEALGTPVVSPALWSVSAAGAIASAEAFGTSVVGRGTVSITAVGAIASAEVFGTEVVSFPPWPITAAGGIATGEVFGTTVVGRAPWPITAAGAIASAEAFGTSVIGRGVVNVTAVGGIASAEALGNPTLTALASVSAVGGIGSGESFGTSVVGAGAVTLTAVGAIGSAEAFGTAVLTIGAKQILDAGAIGTAEAFGVPVLTVGPVNITQVGAIASAEAFGLTVVAARSTIANVGAITSAEAFGTSVVGRGVWAILDAGAIGSQEAFGTPVLGSGGASISTQAIASQEQFGTAVVAPGSASITTVGISSTEAFGVLNIGGIYQVSTQGIPPEEAFGLGRISISVTAVGGIASTENVPLPKLSYSFALAALGNIASQEAFGIMLVNGGAIIWGPEPGAVIEPAFTGEVQVSRNRPDAVIYTSRPTAEVIREQ
jgi:hypothetical protein